MATISVIVPVYKVENFLDECIQSILNQDFSDFELILVDDGSPDNCGAICEKYADCDERITVIHQENRGLSGARNSGMEIATGEYITFIDSDDIVSENYLSTLYNAIKSDNADMAVCVNLNFNDGNAPGLKAQPDVNQNYTYYDGRAAVCRLYNGDDKVTMSAIGKLFKTELISEMRFPEGRVHEDQAFIPIAYYNAQKVVCADPRIYHYRVRAESITHDKFKLKRYDDIWAVDKCMEFFEKNEEQEILKAARKKRQTLLSVYYIYAWRDKVKVPKEYRVGLLKAVRFLRKNVATQRYQYYLAQIHPVLARMHEYKIKIKRMLRILP